MPCPDLDAGGFESASDFATVADSTPGRSTAARLGFRSARALLARRLASLARELSAGSLGCFHPRLAITGNLASVASSVYPERGTADLTIDSQSTAHSHD